MNAMRETGNSGWVLHHSARTALRALRLAAVVLGVGVVMTAGIARAADPEEDDDATFEEKIIKNIMTGIGGTSMDNSGINYRERSPLVVPPRIELRPPESDAVVATAPNWPKDPDVAERKRIKELANRKKVTGQEAARPLMPSELAAAKTKPSTSTEPVAPGSGANGPSLSPSQLGYKGGLFSNVFGGNVAETAPFTGEPTRETLTQPPTGYQTPSPNYAYGTGPKEALSQGGIDIMTGKEIK
jgi:hypothetical protein